NRFHWSRHIGWTVGESSRLAIHEVKFGRTRPIRRHRADPEELSSRRIWKHRAGPIDITFNARISVTGLGRLSTTDTIVAIPVIKEWRPTISGSVMTVLLPQ